MTPATVALRLEVRGSRHPGGQHPDWFDDVVLVAYTVHPNREQILLRGNLELQPMLEWLRDCEQQIRQQRPLTTQRAGETIGQTLARSYDAIGDNLPRDDIDIASEALYQYNAHHNLSVGAPGMNSVPRLLLGLGSDGTEIANSITDISSESA
ncbi:hypothetical protein [Williamsia sterculiae]|uniref:hypothetical protein n=1 Tax=Williamsia sterculiae TaxID=1344003 RepID=UPI00117CE007|nr:hypothetical protein [Williamsia sterculiae]